MRSLVWSLAFLCFLVPGRAQGREFPTPTNNQAITDTPLSDPSELVGMMDLPDGFEASVFAAEPDVRNPIAMCWDEKGRMWVAENYTYSDHKERFDLKLRDRILIFEDLDQDGRFDRRQVVTDDLQRLTSIERGFGGIFALCPPHLLFLPTVDDQVRGPAQVLLDGFETKGAQRHTLANGLKWGPDGWLYGRIGISQPCRVGLPDTPPDERAQLAGGIWRYHPGRKIFEPYCHGTTNPWGSDWNEDGELFFINTVIGHLWHGIRGAHFKRMHGQDPYPHIYELIDQHADHYHWDTGQTWQKSRNAAAGADALGGGHAHVGLTIYQGTQFPERYRGRLFTTNLHGRRINVERLESLGSGYVGRHEPDFMTTTDPWFRAVEISTGPLGSLFVLDWSDIGECHEHDGVHRSSGRIYRISHGKPELRPLDLSALSNRELIELQKSPNEWMVRMSRWLLRERHLTMDPESRGELLAEIRSAMKPHTRDKQNHLRHLWLVSTLSDDPLAHLTPEQWLRNTDPMVCRQLIHLTTNKLDSRTDWWKTVSDPATLAREPRIRLALASALPSLERSKRMELARLLLSHPEDHTDHNLPLVIWSGICDLPPDRLVSLFESCQIPKIRVFISRRVATEIHDNPQPLTQLLSIRPDIGAAERISGMAQAFRGWKSAPKPSGWDQFFEQTADLSDQRLARLRLAILFGNKQIIADFEALVANPNAQEVQRRFALSSLVQLQPSNLRSICEKHLSDPALASIAIRGLASFRDPSIAQRFLTLYPKWPEEARQEALAVMASRPKSAELMLETLGETIPTEDMTVSIARQVKSLGQKTLNQKLADEWGLINDSSDALRKQVEHYRKKLTPALLKGGRPTEGQSLFQVHCGSCHTLFGKGGTLGPDLTGGGRHSIDYLVENIVDPSAVVASDQTLTMLHLNDGRVLIGMVRERDNHTLTLDSGSGPTVISTTGIRREERLAQSMMPPGLLDPLTDQQLADLFAYLQSDPDKK